MRLHHVAILVSDRQKALDFYLGALGFELKSEIYREERKSYKMDIFREGIYLELFTFPDAPERPSYPEALGLRHLAFGVEDIEEKHQELRSKGVRGLEEIRVDTLTGKRFFFFPDPDDLPIEFYEN